MAKKSKIAKQVQRELMVEHYSQKRKELKIKGDYLGLSRLPRNASPTRLRNRDKIDGRSRGYLREFGLSRINFRKLALEGKIPGVRKASW